MDCRKCGAIAPSDDPEELLDLGWNPGERLCPTCRAERNARAAATTNRIVGGLAQHYAARFGPDSRVVKIESLPELVTRSTWVAAPGALEPGEADAVWRELGPGFYLWTLTSGAQRMYATVNVGEDGSVDIEHIEGAEIPAIQDIARLLLPTPRIS
jgi:hypothetical protein